MAGKQAGASLASCVDAAAGAAAGAALKTAAMDLVERDLPRDFGRPGIPGARHSEASYTFLFAFEILLRICALSNLSADSRSRCGEGGGGAWGGVKDGEGGGEEPRARGRRGNGRGAWTPRSR